MTTLITRGTGTGAGSVAAGDDPRFNGLWVPTDLNLNAWSFDNASITGTIAPAAGQGYYTKVKIPAPFTVAKVYWMVGTAASAEVNNVFFGVFNSSGTRLGVTTNQSSAMQTSTVQNATLTVDGGQSLALAGGTTVYVGMVIGTQGVTAGQLRAGASGSTAAANPAATGASLRSGSVGSGLSALPTSITPSGLAPTGLFWFGLQ